MPLDEKGGWLLDDTPTYTPEQQKKINKLIEQEKFKELVEYLESLKA